MTEIFGILNLTPDSFSDGGRYNSPETALQQAELLLEQGATVIDIGGESTRPGSLRVSPKTEQERILSTVSKLAAAGVCVSVDTVHAETAEAALNCGAQIINDVSGGLHDERMYEVVAGFGARYVLGHWRGFPDPAHSRSNYSDVTAEVTSHLHNLTKQALAAGVKRENIIIDPGLGFDKTAAQCWQLLRELDQLTALDFPVLVGASRKRMIAELLTNLRADQAAEPGLSERDSASAFAAALAVQNGAWGVRVHNAGLTKQALSVLAAVGTTVAADPLPKKPETMEIALKGVEVFAHHGVFDFEKRAGQRFVIDALLLVAKPRGGFGDELANTVNYGELAEALHRAASEDAVDLLETLAERLAQVALDFAGVLQAKITVHKPDAPITVPFADVAVSVTKSLGESR